MPSSHLARLACAVAIVIAAPGTAHAEGQTVHRCIGEHGEISFSGLPCAGASAPASGVSSTAATTADRSTEAPTCPASADALRDVVADAFARRDPNAIAGVMRWDGVGGATARERMRDLAELMGQPLLGIDIDGTSIGAPGDVTPQSALLTVRTGNLGGGASAHEFRLMPVGGCYWLDW